MKGEGSAARERYAVDGTRCDAGRPCPIATVQAVVAREALAPDASAQTSAWLGSRGRRGSSGVIAVAVPLAASSHRGSQSPARPARDLI
jgi:hypothetical protein